VDALKMWQPWRRWQPSWRRHRWQRWQSASRRRGHASLLQPVDVEQALGKEPRAVDLCESVAIAEIADHHASLFGGSVASADFPSGVRGPENPLSMFAYARFCETTMTASARRPSYALRIRTSQLKTRRSLSVYLTSGAGGAAENARSNAARSEVGKSETAT
jgi:hypothetical protein